MTAPTSIRKKIAQTGKNAARRDIAAGIVEVERLERRMKQWTVEGQDAYLTGYELGLFVYADAARRDYGTVLHWIAKYQNSLDLV